MFQCIAHDVMSLVYAPSMSSRSPHNLDPSPYIICLITQLKASKKLPKFIVLRMSQFVVRTNQMFVDIVGCGIGYYEDQDSCECE